MRPPMATDHVEEKRKRILYTKKHAPYNSGEERTVAESVARRLCVLGVAIPAPARKDITEIDTETGEKKIVADEQGGWSLSEDEAAARDRLDRARKEAAGDFAGEVAEQEARRREEERRVEEQAKKKAEAQKDKAAAKKQADDKKKGGFLKGQGAKKDEPKG